MRLPTRSYYPALPVENVLFGGQKAATANHDKLKQAESLEQSGASPEENWKVTGWWRDARDKKWRFEIPDTNALLGPQADQIFGPKSRQGAATPTGPGVALPNFLTHPEFYAAYPGARQGGNDGSNALMHFTKGGEEGEALTSPAISQVPEAERDPAMYQPSQYIELLAPDRPTARSVGLHEVQHYIQNLEGFTQGTDPSRAGTQGYLNNHGEIEARQVQARSKMTPQQLAAQPPWMTEPYTHPLQRRK